MAGDGSLHLGRILYVGPDHLQLRAGGQLVRVAGQRGDLVATGQQFFQQGIADETGGANQCDFHWEFLGG
ncbi:hypothetical protein D3C81_755300 [compost metagenome]